MDRPHRGSGRPPTGLGGHLGRLGRPGPGPLEDPGDTDVRTARSLRLKASGPRHRRPDSTGPWIRDAVPGLYTITQRRAYRGMYRGGDSSLVSPEWVEQNIHGHGPLGDLYPNYDGGDIWSAKRGRVRGIKEGDTPSFLSLVPNGLGDVKRPWLGSWGGRFEGGETRLTDAADGDLDTSGDPDPRMSSVYRWRAVYQADFAARLDWCVQPYAGANHPPLVRIRGERDRKAKAGDVVALDAEGTTDPDGDGLDFTWGVYPFDPSVAGRVVIEGRDTPRARVMVLPMLVGKTIPILVAVTDRGKPRLTRYGRVLITVE